MTANLTETHIALLPGCIGSLVKAERQAGLTIESPYREQSHSPACLTFTELREVKKTKIGGIE